MSIPLLEGFWANFGNCRLIFGWFPLLKSQSTTNVQWFQTIQFCSHVEKTVSVLVPECFAATAELRNLFSSHRAAVWPLIVNHCQNCQTPGKSTCGLDRHWKPFISRSTHELDNWCLPYWQSLKLTLSIWCQRTYPLLSKIWWIILGVPTAQPTTLLLPKLKHSQKIWGETNCFNWCRNPVHRKWFVW